MIEKQVALILLEHGMNDTNIKLGETIRYTPSEVEAILAEHKDKLDFGGHIWTVMWINNQENKVQPHLELFVTEADAMAKQMELMESLYSMDIWVDRWVISRKD